MITNFLYDRNVYQKYVVSRVVLSFSRGNYKWFWQRKGRVVDMRRTKESNSGP